MNLPPRNESERQPRQEPASYRDRLTDSEVSRKFSAMKGEPSHPTQSHLATISLSASASEQRLRRLCGRARSVTRRTELEPTGRLTRAEPTPNDRAVLVENLLLENGIVGLGVGTVLCFDTHSSDVNQHELSPQYMIKFHLRRSRRCLPLEGNERLLS